MSRTIKGMLLGTLLLIIGGAGMLRREGRLMSVSGSAAGAHAEAPLRPALRFVSPFESRRAHRSFQPR